MKQLVDLYRKVVVQLATPYSTGTGFCLPGHQLIVTSDHIVRDNREVIVEGFCIDRQLIRVLYSDPAYDLAFLEMPTLSGEIPDVSLGQADDFSQGLPMLALGHPFGNPYSAKEGVLIQFPYTQGDIDYFQHDAAAEAVNNGGPVVNASGQIIGVNTFASWEEGKSGLAIPVRYLREAIASYESGNGQIGGRCFNCGGVVFDPDMDIVACPHCGVAIELPSNAPVYEPEGVSKSIETLLEENGYAVALSRIGPNNWEVREGSARIDISYYEKTGLIVGDAYLCSLPPDPSKSLYEYLLKQNYQTQGLAFSVKGQDIVLSLLIYDRYLNADTAARLFKHLFERADYYDNILVEQYGAYWKADAGPAK
ncbi:MAG: trypsin-like peptidase domain-containing protein [Bacteroidota bacterium]